MTLDYTSLEDLLLATLDAVSRFRVGQRDAVGAALEAGPLLTKAKGQLQHGQWADWLFRVGLAPRTASTWMKLSGMDLTAEEVIDRGGINAVSWPKLRPRYQTPKGNTTMLSVAATPL